MTGQVRLPLPRPARNGRRTAASASPSRALSIGSRAARRAWQVALAACAFALIPATAATAATPTVSAAKDRSAGDVTIGAVIIIVLLVVLFLAYRVIRKRLRG